MDYNKEKILAELIVKIRFGIATEEEKSEVNVWLAEKEEHRFLYEKIVSGRSVVEHLEKESEFNAKTNFNLISDRVKKQIHKKKVQRRNKVITWSAVAACLVGVVFSGLFFLLSEPGTTVLMAEGTPEKLVNDKVVLVLSTGETIGLSGQVSDSIKLKQTIIVKKNDQLSYEVNPDSTGSFVDEGRNKIITGVGGEYSFVLGDGTKVWLNAESELDFPVNFVANERVVKLKGEAYFEVTPDATRPFLVETKDVRTRVLGTSFNIKAYDNETSVFTTLLTGKVEVAAIDKEGEAVILTPGMQSEWQKGDHEMLVKKVVSENFIAWKQGSFMFDNEDISVVTRLLERWYGVEFIYNSGSERKHTFSGCLSKDESLESILETLTFTGGPRFVVENNVVYIVDKK